MWNFVNNKFKKDDIIELDRETEQMKEYFILCENCFQERVDDLRKEYWNVDDFLEEEEEWRRKRRKKRKK